MGIGGLQMAGAFNSTMSAISTVAGVATRVGQISKLAQKFAGAGGGGVAPAPTPSINTSSLVHQGGSLTMSGGGGMDNIAISMGQMGPSISMPAQSSIYANPLTNVPAMRFKMGSQNNSLFVTKHGGGGNNGGNGGMNGGSGIVQ